MNVREQLEQLSPEKRALLMQRLRERPSVRPTISTQPRSEGVNTFPLSFAQQRLWFLHQLAPDSAAYNLSFAYRLRGRLDVAMLRCALDEIVRRHEILRATYALVGDSPVQHVAAQFTPELALIEVNETNGEQAVLTHALSEKQKPFALADAPPIRTTLLCLNEQEHVLLLTMHHIIADGWSSGVLAREMVTLYQAFVDEAPSPLAELPIQYTDYAVWQRQDSREAELSEHLNYWKEQLAPPLPTMDLPVDGVWRDSAENKIGQLNYSVPLSLWQEMKTLAHSHQATPFMLILATLSVLLNRYTEQEDIIIGTPIANQNQPQLNDLIGLFLNTLPLRSHVSGHLDFLTLLQQARTIVLDGFAHRDAPFEKIVEAVSPPRDLNRTPIFDILFNFINTPAVSLSLPELTIEWLELPEVEAKYAITLYAQEQENGLDLRLIYRQGLFSNERMAFLLKQLHRLFEQIVADPTVEIQDYSLVLPDDSAVVLPDPTELLETPRYPLVTEAFDAVAARLPNQTALRQGEQIWSYEKLATQARAIAHRLQESGHKPGDVIAVTGLRSFGLIAGMLGVFQSGCVLLNIDPILPDKRRQQMMDLSGAVRQIVIATEPEHVEQLTIVPDVPIMTVDPAAGISTESTPSLAYTITPDDPAYIFFTSGSTGTPKGVLGNHRGLSHFLAWQRETFAIDHTDRAAQLTGISFDVVLRDIFTPLTGGATLCLPDKLSIAPDYIIPWLEREKITLMHTVPSLLQLWLAMGGQEMPLDNLRWIFSAGEALKDGLVQRWYDAFPDSGTFVNIYGPTETTLAKCFHVVNHTPEPGVQPLGTPLPDTQIWVVNPQGKLCGVGEPGEIVIRTPFRSSGYLADSADTFLPNPFTADPADLIYHTGDRGRYRPDGLLEFMGRIDHQVKINGVRIELGEIEAAIIQHPQVQNAAVSVRENEQRKYLVAYLVERPGEAIVLAELYRVLAQQLPNAMVPSNFVKLDSLPLLPNGKINRRALPDPDMNEPEEEDEAVAPRNPFEKIVAGLMAGVLSYNEKVNASDNFFALGAHSLQAIQLVSRVRETFEVDISAQDPFTAPTVAELAKRIQDAGGTLPTSNLPPITPTSRSGLIPFTVGQQATWETMTGGKKSGGLLKRLFGRKTPKAPRSTAGYTSAVQFAGALDVNLLAECFDQVLHRHEILRTHATVKDGQPTLTQNGAASLEIDTAPNHAAVEAAIETLTTHPFDLMSGSLLHARLLTVDAQSHTLLLKLSALIGDAWSLDIFTEELLARYHARVAGKSAESSPTPLQFNDFAAWQTQLLADDTLADQLDYWQTELQADSFPVLMHASHVAPGWRSLRGVAVSAEAFTRLQALAQREGVTPTMWLLSVLELALHTAFTHTRFTINVATANRAQPGTETLIGPLANEFPFIADLDTKQSFRALLHQVRKQELQTMSYRDIPFPTIASQIKLRDAALHTVIRTASLKTPAIRRWRFKKLPTSMQTQPAS